MYTLLKPLDVRTELLRHNLTVWNNTEFQRLFKTTASRAKYFLETYTAQGLFVRLKQGLYALSDAMPSEQELANLLYRPSYLSFEYALAFYGRMPEMVYTITSATTKPTRTFTIGEKTFQYFTIKSHAFNGYTPVKKASRTILIAEPEKAIVDYLYFVALGKKTWNDRVQFDGLKRDMLLEYATLYERAGLDDLIKRIV